MLAGIVAAGLCACGGDRVSLEQAASAVYEASAKDRLEVARVNGVPIYGDCVATQAQALNLSRRQALEQCIDFELLAQAARDRGYLSHPSVVRTSRVESVRALLENLYPITSPDQIPESELRRFWGQPQIRNRYIHDEARKMVFCVTPLPRDRKPTDAENEAARRIAEQVYRRLAAADRADPDTLRAICAEVDSEYDDHDLAAAEHGAFERGFVPPVREPLFAMKEVNEFAGPIRTARGWFVILLEDILEARNVPFEEARADIARGLFSSKEAQWWRMGTFDEWYQDLAKRHAIDQYPDRIPDRPIGGP